MKLSKQEILDAFKLVEDTIGENVIEYIILYAHKINPTRVIEYLKSVDKYDDVEYLRTRRLVYNDKGPNDKIRQEIGVGKLRLYSFLDMAEEFAFGKYNDEYNNGYELAAEFLSSDYCSEEQFKLFMNKAIYYEHMDDDEKIMKIRRKIGLW